MEGSSLHSPQMVSVALNQWHQQLPSSLQYTSQNVWIRKSTGQLDAFFTIHLTFHAACLLLNLESQDFHALEISHLLHDFLQTGVAAKSPNLGFCAFESSSWMIKNKRDGFSLEGNVSVMKTNLHILVTLSKSWASMGVMVGDFS